VESTAGPFLAVVVVVVVAAAAAAALEAVAVASALVAAAAAAAAAAVHPTALETHMTYDSMPHSRCDDAGSATEGYLAKPARVRGVIK